MAAHGPKVVQLLLGSTWNLSRIADASGVARDTINKWRHALREPSRESLLKIASAFDAHARDSERIAEKLRKEAERAE